MERPYPRNRNQSLQKRIARQRNRLLDFTRLYSTEPNLARVVCFHQSHLQYLLSPLGPVALQDRERGSRIGPRRARRVRQQHLFDPRRARLTRVRTDATVHRPIRHQTSNGGKTDSTSHQPPATSQTAKPPSRFGAGAITDHRKIDRPIGRKTDR